MALDVLESASVTRLRNATDSPVNVDVGMEALVLKIKASLFDFCFS